MRPVSLRHSSGMNGFRDQASGRKSVVSQGEILPSILAQVTLLGQGCSVAQLVEQGDVLEALDLTPLAQVRCLSL